MTHIYCYFIQNFYIFQNNFKIMKKFEKKGMISIFYLKFKNITEKFFYILPINRRSRSEPFNIIFGSYRVTMSLSIFFSFNIGIKIKTKKFFEWKIIINVGPDNTTLINLDKNSNIYGHPLFAFQISLSKIIGKFMES